MQPSAEGTPPLWGIVAAAAAAADAAVGVAAASGRVAEKEMPAAAVEFASAIAAVAAAFVGPGVAGTVVDVAVVVGGESFE